MVPMAVSTLPGELWRAGIHTHSRLHTHARLHARSPPCAHTRHRAEASTSPPRTQSRLQCAGAQRLLPGQAIAPVTCTIADTRAPIPSRLVASPSPASERPTCLARRHWSLSRSPPPQQRRPAWTRARCRLSLPLAATSSTCATRRARRLPTRTTLAMLVRRRRTSSTGP